jgi:D-alanine-D-alanine ligase
MDIGIFVYVEQEGSTECDKSIDQIAGALRRNGHEPTIVHVHADVHRFLTELQEQQFDLVFNLLEQFGEGNLGLIEATGLFELLQVPYTGSGPGELYLQQDKALTKKLLAYENIQTPDFAVFTPDADFETGGKLRMPLFVKPLQMDSSLGIEAPKSLVHKTTELLERVQQIQKEFGDGALCEQYIEGREFYVGVLGNSEAQAFPPVEMDFSKMPDGMPHVMDANAKFNEESVEFKSTKPIVAELPDELRARLQQVALHSYRALRMRDYGRVDMRLSETGEIYVIEVNANCYLEQESEFAMAAKAAGIEFDDMIQRIVDLAQQRNEQAARLRVVAK